MFVTFATEDYSTTEQIDIKKEMDVTELKGLLSAIIGIPAKSQVFVCNGKELATTGTVESIGIKENDLVLVVRTKAKTVPSLEPINSNTPFFYEGMPFEEVMERNKDPANIVKIVQSNDYLLRQANFHNEMLGKLFKKDAKTATKELRKFMMMSSAVVATRRLQARNQESAMTDKLKSNPNDLEAKKYFKEKERQALVQEQFYQVMNEYPESMTRVLMLYINVFINKEPVQAFVDSGAQTSVMSLSCAKRLELDHLIDSKFSAQMVGVGSAKSLGRIHIAPLSIEGNFFPITLTILDDEKGLGDKNMEFLLGLDMLKRHSCNLDLVKGVLTFKNFQGKTISTPFLHEKDLPESKGGTKDFDPSNPTKNHPKPGKKN